MNVAPRQPLICKSHYDNSCQNITKTPSHMHSYIIILNFDLNRKKTPTAIRIWHSQCLPLAHKQLNRFPFLLSHAFSFSVQQYVLLKLMWNDCNSSRPPPHIPSPVRGVLYCMFTQYCLLSFLSFLCPPVHSKCPLRSCLPLLLPLISLFLVDLLRCLTRTWCVDRRLPRAVQQQREVRPGSERLALHLPVGLERAGMRCSDGNALLRWQG